MEIVKEGKPINLRETTRVAHYVDYLYLSKSWSYRTELSPLVRYNLRPSILINGAKEFSLQTPCNLNHKIKA